MCLWNECWILPIHSSPFSILLCVLGGPLKGLQQQTPLPFGFLLGLANGSCQEKKGREEWEVGIFIPSTLFLLGHCKLVASLYQRPKLLWSTFLAATLSEFQDTSPRHFPLLAYGGNSSQLLLDPECCHILGG